MKYTSSLFVLSFATTILATPVPRDSPGFLRIPIEQRPTNTSNIELVTGKVKATVPEPLENRQVQYVASFTVGTPGQKSEAALDTGSSDLWIYGSDSGAAQPLFDTSKSSTYKFLSNDFEINYVKGSASGDWVTDTLTVGGAAVTNQQFAVSHQAVDTAEIGVFGIALQSTESTKTKYANFPQSLKDQGYISRVAYSLYLEEPTASSGSILFGGVDTAKYTGKLQKFSFTSSSAFFANFKVAGYSTNGVLDSGTTFTYLPQQIVDTVASQYNLDESYDGYYYTSSKPSGSGLTYTFGSTNIVVPIADLFLYDESSGLYILTIFPNSQSQNINLLGDSFLRAAYVVYDLESLTGAIAQAKYTSTSNIVAITSSIPGAST